MWRFSNQPRRFVSRAVSSLPMVRLGLMLLSGYSPIGWLAFREFGYFLSVLFKSLPFGLFVRAWIPSFAGCITSSIAALLIRLSGRSGVLFILLGAASSGFCILNTSSSNDLKVGRWLCRWRYRKRWFVAYMHSSQGCGSSDTHLHSEGHLCDRVRCVVSSIPY